MNNIVDTDCIVMQERTLPVIASEILVIEQQVYQNALAGAIQIGEKLHEAKEKVPHGQWENWCKENLNYSDRKAQNLMQLATENSKENGLFSKPHTCADLSISKALRLLQVPEEDRENFIKNNEVSDMTVKELEEEIRALKEGKEKAEGSLSDREKDLSELERRFEIMKDELAEMEKKQAESEERTNESSGEELEAAMAEANKAKLQLEELRSEVREANKKILELNAVAANSESEKKLAIKEAVEAEKKVYEDRIKEQLEAANDAARAKARSESEDTISELRESNERLLQEIELMEKRSSNAANEEILTFKAKVDLLQKIHADCETAAYKCEEPDKALNALKVVLKSLLGE